MAVLNVGPSPGLKICLRQSDIWTLIQYGHQIVSILEQVSCIWGAKRNIFLAWETWEIIHPYRTITTLAILSSSLTQYYCVMSDNLFTLLGGPHQQYLMIFPLNKIMTMCDNLLNQILVTIPIIRIFFFFFKCMIALMIRIWLNKLSHIAQYYWVGGLLNIIDMIE